jgi:hypothetical protein
MVRFCVLDERAAAVLHPVTEPPTPLLGSAFLNGNDRKPGHSRRDKQGVRTGASKTVTPKAGTYVLVVDNTDIGEAGDIGEESPRSLTVTIEAQSTE